MKNIYFKTHMILNFDGHICLGTVRHKDSENYTMLALCEMDKKYPIGTDLAHLKNVKPTDFKRSVLLKFKDPRSIDLIIGLLNEIKKDLNENF